MRNDMKYFDLKSSPSLNDYKLQVIIMATQ